MSLWSELWPFGAVRASASARARAQASARLDAIGTASDSATFVAGGRVTKGALPVTTELFEGAVYSSRGRGYARYNEDAGGLFTDAHGHLYAFALDQAGGLGGKIRGEASRLAAEHLFRAFQALAKEKKPKRSVIEGRVLEAMMSAHRALLDRGQGEVTTAVAAVALEDEILTVNTGDSGALLVDATGRVVERTTMHELPPPNDSCLLQGIGLTPEGCAPEAYRWAWSAAHWVVLASDGLLDAELTDAELADALGRGLEAEAAVNRLSATVLREMGRQRAKPDNLTIVALRRRAGGAK